MKYNKLHLSFDQQADRLIQRGLIADRTILIKRLQSVNYYRLTGYLFPFRLPDNSFKPNTSFDMVWQNYCFDRQLRLLIFDACERIETALKTNVVYELSLLGGGFCHLDLKSLPNLKRVEHEKLLRIIKEETKRSKEVFVAHFFDKYGDKHDFLPLWMVAEVLSFGTIHNLFKGLTTQCQKSISEKYFIDRFVFISWMHAIKVIRNACAHNGRLYNRELGVKPRIPNKEKKWNEPKKIDNSRIFSILTILNYLLQIIAPESNWKIKLITLLDENQGIPLSVMGFYEGWETHGLWE